MVFPELHAMVTAFGPLLPTAIICGTFFAFAIRIMLR